MVAVRDSGVEAHLATESLQIDETYQRGFNALKAKRIGQKFDMRALGRLSVSERSDGTWWVVDGQHRRAGALAAGVTSVPCIIYSGLSAKEEAELFLVLNCERSGMGAAGRFNAQQAAGQEIAMVVARTLASVQLNDYAKKKLIGTMIRVATFDEPVFNAMTVAFNLAHALEPKAPGARLLGAFGYLEWKLSQGGQDHTLAVSFWRDRILSIGHEELTECMSRTAALMRKTGMRTGAWAIQERLNKGLRTSRINVIQLGDE